jgi:predicted transcriptional regulator
MVRLQKMKELTYKQCKDIYYNNASFHKSIKPLIHADLVNKHKNDSLCFFRITLEGEMFTSCLRKLGEEIPCQKK